MLFSGFPGLAQLGLFSIAGLVAAAAVTRWVLPELVPRGYSVKAVDALAPVLLRMIARGRALRIPLLVTVLVLAVWLAVQGATPWNDELSGLSPVSMSDQRLDEAAAQGSWRAGRAPSGRGGGRFRTGGAGNGRARRRRAVRTAGRRRAGGLRFPGALSAERRRTEMPASGRFRMPKNCAATWPARRKACRFVPEHLRPSSQKRKRQKSSPRWCVRICKARRWR